MAFDTVIDKAQFESALTASANAIREKTGSTDSIEWLADKGFADAIGAIETGGGGGSDEEWFNDGDTHIWITLSDGRTSPILGICLNGTATVDWGDGTAPDVITGTSLISPTWTPRHEYASAGDYVISLSIEGQANTKGYNQESYIFRNQTEAGGLNKAYLMAVKKVEIGSGILTVHDSSFYNCKNMVSVLIHSDVTSIEYQAFSSCYALEYAIIKGVTSIGTSAFSGCNTCFSYDFSEHTLVPTLKSTNAFSNIPPDCEIRVPAALYDEWIAASNWSTYARNIVAV